MLYASYRHYRNHSGRLDCCNATHLRCTKFYITRSGYILTSYSKTSLYSEFAFIEFLMQGSPVSNPGVIDLLIEVTTTPSTVADSEILMHRRRSQIPKY